MRQTKEKSEFLNQLKTEIKHDELLTSVYNSVFQDVLTAYDGKVYNKRFINALNEKLQALDPLLYAKEENGTSRDSYSNYPDDFGVTITISCRFDKFNYADREILYSKIIVIPSTYRIDAEKSRTEKYTTAWYKNFVASMDEKRGIIKNYDKYLKVAAKVAGAIKEFSQLPGSFRKNITFSNKFYLQ